MNNDDSPASDALETKVIEIDGLHSRECAQEIEQALRKTDGVQRAEVNVDSGYVTVTFDTRRTHVPALHDVILQTGYKPKPFADD